MDARLVLGLSLFGGIFAAGGAFAAEMTHGVAASLNLAPEYNGLPASGGELSVRWSKLELAGGVMLGSADMKTATQLNAETAGSTNSGLVQKAAIEQKSTSLTLKFHPMDGSFYFGFGGGVGRTVGTLRMDDGAPGQKLERVMTIDRQVTTFSVGNIWTPGGVVIGCDWAGLSKARHTTRKTEVRSMPGVSSGAYDEAQSEFDRSVMDVGEGDTSSLLVLHVGFMLGT